MKKFIELDDNFATKYTFHPRTGQELEFTSKLPRFGYAKKLEMLVNKTIVKLIFLLNKYLMNSTSMKFPVLSNEGGRGLFNQIKNPMLDAEEEYC